ncbi:MAG: GMC family oxidoreductase [Phycisphaeraceae bacterium]|nr:GMC family oxidoreductase [Phycisphaeraceae bacterium]
MQRDGRYDVIIIGSGAGGGTLARHLAPSGKRILIVERGGFLPREWANWDPKAVFEEQRYLAKETWYDRDDRPFTPFTHYCVGGNTKVYGAALLRMREDDFGEVRHYGGISPAWPITYEDLEPYYTRAERMYSVHGRRGSDPHEPRASSPYPFPPIEHEPRMREVFEDLRALGHRPFPIPLGVRLPEPASADRPASSYRLGRFDGYPDVTEVKADAQVCGVGPALAYPNVSLVTGCVAERLETDESGRRVIGVVVRREGTGERVVLSGDVVVAACGAVNTAALMLRSANERHPRGLANSSDQVGRNYMTHNNGMVIAVTEGQNPSQFQKSFGLTEFYRGAPDSALPLGTIQLMGKPDPGTLAFMAKGTMDNVPVEELAKRTVDFFITAEDLPDAQNRVLLRGDGAIRIAYTQNNIEAYDRLEAKLREMMDAAERRHGRAAPTYLTLKLGVNGVSHQCGTMRMGSDPATSVVDPSCRAHDVDNLYVADSSCFVSSSAVNPSLTIMANAMRVGDEILGRIGCPSCSALAAEMEGSAAV